MSPLMLSVWIMVATFAVLATGIPIAFALALVSTVFFLVILFYSSIELTNHAWVKNIKTPTIWSFPMWKVYIFLPIGMGIMILQYLADILSIIYNVKEN